MRRRLNNIFFEIDLTLVLLYTSLLVFGWMSIYATSFSGAPITLDFNTEYTKQLVWIGFSIVLIALILIIDTKVYENFSYIIYFISLISLIGLFIFGKKINGATSWYDFGIIGIQPSEFVKFTTLLALARLLSDKQYDLKFFNNQIKAFAIISIPIFLIALQPDPGSALVYLSFLLMLYIEGINTYYILIGIIFIILFILTLLFGFSKILYGSYLLLLLVVIYSKIYGKRINLNLWKTLCLFLLIGLYIFSVDHLYNNIFGQRHRDRFNILLLKNTDPQGIGYNTNQSILTIKSGGFSGKGYLKGDRTQGNFVPEQHTDYIFSAIGEEWGFLGTATVTIIFTAFVFRIIQLAGRQKRAFSRIYGYGVASIFFFHYSINIAMAIGLFPTIGIPLPFFSYGGSGLFAFTILLFIFVKLDSNRAYEL